MAISGYIEFLSIESVRGWAFDSEAPCRRLKVIVEIAGVPCVSGFADILRADLTAAGIGDGHHGFDVDLPAAAVSSKSASDLEVRVLSGDSSIRLQRAQKMRNLVVALGSDAQAPIRDESQFPLFILGPARSGTSVMALGLLASGRYEGTGEGHLLPLAHALVADVDKHYSRFTAGSSETMVARVPVEAFQKLIRRTFVQLARDLFPTRYWLDKTPTVEMVRAAPLLRELWPNSRFIFMKRRAIENLMSRQRKFPQDSPEMHYSDWTAVMNAWLEVRDGLADAYVEVDHRDLTLRPDPILSTMADLLNLSADETLRLKSYVLKHRPEQTDHSFGAIYSLDQLGITDDEQVRFRDTCGATMTAFGYSYDSSYYAP